MKTDIKDQEFLDWGLSVIDIEATAVSNLKNSINQDFINSCNVLLGCKGKVIVTGMGKSGHIGKKIAATLASTGTPAFFLHPGEALHGDLGMISKNDVIIALSNSGESSEILNIIPMIKRLNIPLISITGNSNSSIAKNSDYHLDIRIEKEACSLGLAPTASTTATLVLGDALAISLLNARGFTEDDFARSHPAGKLGRKLLIKISDIMHSDENIPKVHENSTIANALIEMTKKRLGMTTIINDDSNMVGIFTDGDLRRIIDKGIDIHNTLITEVMTRKFISVPSNMLAAQAVSLMEQHSVLALPVIDDSKLVGAFNMHDLFQAKII